MRLSWLRVEAVTPELDESVELKLALLADGDVHRRVGRIVAAIEEVRPMLEASAMREGHGDGSN